MPLFEWSDELSVKVSEINAEHKKLIGMMNSLNDAMSTRKGKEAIGKILQEMVDYTRVHFRTEENYMKIFRYPGLFSHQREHKRFVDKTLDLQKRFVENKLLLSVEVMQFLKDWLQTHIKGVDKKYSQCFNENGLN